MTNLELSIEEWNEIPEYNGLYLISSHGRIIRKTNKGRRFLNPWKHRTGYILVELTMNGITKSYRVHRLVAEGFIPNPEIKPFVNHIDGDKGNNHVSNLEWVTKSENEIHAYATGLKPKTLGEEWFLHRQNVVNSGSKTHTLSDIHDFFILNSRLEMAKSPETRASATSCSGYGENIKPRLSGAFSFISSFGVKMGSKKYITYRPPKVVKAKQKWYVEYYYRIPAELQEKYNKKEWQRFRVYEDINRIKTDDYAGQLRDAVALALEEGFNPFQNEQDSMVQESKIEWSLNVALDKFIQNCTDNGLRGKTLQTYGTVVNFMKDYFIKDNSLYRPITAFGKGEIKAFMTFTKTKQGWNNNTYNGYLGHVRNFFNFLIKEDKLTKNPANGLELKKVAITKHKYYTDQMATDLRNAMSVANPYLLKFCSFIYYTATRPKSEARLLQCKHVLFDRKLLFIPASISKNKKDDYIPMSEELITILKEMGVDNSDKYIFSAKGRPDEKPASQNYFASLFKPFKDKLGLDESYTIYGYKHLRAIHLIHDGVQPYELMKLFRHSDLSTTSIYLRELGLTVNAEAINSKTRKF